MRFREATDNAMHAPMDSPTRYIGLSGTSFLCDLTILSTTFTKSIETLKNNSQLLSPCLRKISRQQNREFFLPKKGVRSVTGMCKHHTSNILPSFLCCKASPAPVPSIPETKNSTFFLDVSLLITRGNYNIRTDRASRVAVASYPVEARTPKARTTSADHRLISPTAPPSRRTRPIPSSVLSSSRHPRRRDNSH